MPSWAAVAVFGLLTSALSTGYTRVARSWIRWPCPDVPMWHVMALTFGCFAVNPALYVLAGAVAAPTSFVSAWTLEALGNARSPGGGVQPEARPGPVRNVSM